MLDACLGKSEIEQFWHMEIGGVITTTILVSGRQSRSVNIISSSRIWDFTPRVSLSDKTNPPPGADFSISPSGFNYDMQNGQK